MSYTSPPPASSLPSDPPPAYPGDEKCGYPPSTQPPYSTVSPQYYNQQIPSYGGAPAPTEGVYYQPPVSEGHGGVTTQQPAYSAGFAPLLVVRERGFRSGVDSEYFCHVLLSCVVCWCCCCPLGFVALMLALMAQGLSSSSAASAARLRRASLTLSLTGITVGVLLAVVMGAFKVSRWRQEQEPYRCPWLINGSCFTVRDEFPANNYMNRSCPTGGVRQFNYCYHNGTDDTLGKAPAYNLNSEYQ